LPVDLKILIAIVKASFLKKFAGKLLDIFAPEELESNEK